MTVRSRESAVRHALASHTNVPGTCQLWTRTQFDAPSAGDQDRDGDADAVDGWKSEPASKKHKDRNPPRGVPVAWGGGSHGFGHRAISLGNGRIRSTDAGGSGVVATVDFDFPEKQWGLKYLGWSETIDGKAIPLSAKKKAKKTAARRTARKQARQTARKTAKKAAKQAAKKATPVQPRPPLPAAPVAVTPGIPPAPQPPAQQHQQPARREKSRGVRVDRALSELQASRAKGENGKRIQAAVNQLKKIPLK